MNSTISDAPPIPNAAAQLATRVAFLIAGLAMGAWAPLVPYAKSRALLDERSLGLLLLCLGIGSIVTMPFTGMLAGRLGCRVVIVVASLLIALVLPLLASFSNIPTLAPALFLFGAGVGAVDVAVNIQAVEVEKFSGRALMSGFHGYFSVGGLAGAAGVSGLLWLKFTPLIASLCVSALILLLLAAFARNLLTHRSPQQEPLLALPRGKVWIAGVLCFLLFLTEGSVLDWSAVLLTTFRDVKPDQAGLGYAAFSTAMTLGRLNGDRIVQKLGPNRILQLGGLVTASGMALVVAVPSSLVSMLGFILVGLGASNLVPVLFSMAGRQSEMPPGLAIAAITTIGYSGILCGPAFVGFIADATSLPIALGLIAVALLAVPLTASTVLADRE